MTTPPPSTPSNSGNSWDERTGASQSQPSSYGNPGPSQHPYAPRQDPFAPGAYRAEEQPWDPTYNPYAEQWARANPYAPQQGWYPYGSPYAPQPPQAPKKRHRGRIAAIGVGAVAAVTAVGIALASGSTQAVNGTALGSFDSGSSTSPSTSTPSTTPTVPSTPFVPNGNSGNSGNVGNGGSNGGNTGNGNSGSSGTSGTATATQSVGVVDILATQKYNQAAAAGTGMVLTSDGEILTNNHVIDDSTSIQVTVVSTGKTYTAKVVGTSPTNDIALLKLDNASGLKTINLGDSSSIAVGDKVTGVGNAGGKGGTPSAAKGAITHLNKTITASDETGQNSETLNNVIVTDAPIQSGDSGGPLYNAKDQVIGIDTAASTSGQSIGFAIPINKALSIVSQIKKGIETSSIHIGYPGFLGISVADSASGAVVESALTGGPADEAGIAAGDVITKVGSTTISNGTQLQKAVSKHQPGSKVSVTYTDPSTGSKTVTVTLATGPAD